MRCYICDAALTEVHYNSDHEDFEPCGTCLTVIQDTVGTFSDKASADEDDLGGADPLPEAYFPPDDDFT